MAILFKIGPKPDQGPLSGPGPVRFGPDPEDFSPVRSGTPGTLVHTKWMTPLSENARKSSFWPFIEFVPSKIEFYAFKIEFFAFQVKIVIYWQF